MNITQVSHFFFFDVVPIHTRMWFNQTVSLNMANPNFSFLYFLPSVFYLCLSRYGVLYSVFIPDGEVWRWLVGSSWRQTISSLFDIQVLSTKVTLLWLRSSDGPACYFDTVCLNLCFGYMSFKRLTINEFSLEDICRSNAVLSAHAMIEMPLPRLSLNELSNKQTHFYYLIYDIETFGICRPACCQQPGLNNFLAASTPRLPFTSQLHTSPLKLHQATIR